MIVATRVRMFVKLIERKVGLCQTQIWLTRFVGTRGLNFTYSLIHAILKLTSKFVTFEFVDSGVNVCP